MSEWRAGEQSIYNWNQYASSTPSTWCKYISNNNDWVSSNMAASCLKYTRVKQNVENGRENCVSPEQIAMQNWSLTCGWTWKIVVKMLHSAYTHTRILSRALYSRHLKRIKVKRYCWFNRSAIITAQMQKMWKKNTRCSLKCEWIWIAGVAQNETNGKLIAFSLSQMFIFTFCFASNWTIAVSRFSCNILTFFPAQYLDTRSKEQRKGHIQFPRFAGNCDFVHCVHLHWFWQLMMNNTNSNLPFSP